MTKEFKIPVLNRIDELPKLVQLTSVFASCYKLRDDTVYNIDLVLEELFVILASCAYDDKNEHLILFELSKDGDTVKLNVGYDGKEFNLFNIEYDAKNLSSDTVEDIALGLHFINTLADAKCYYRENERNNIVLKIIDQPDRKTISNILEEKRSFAPPPEFGRRAKINSIEEYKIIYDISMENTELFWAEKAAEQVWFKKWDTVLKEDFAEGKHEWFVGGKINVCYNCLDRHVENGKKDKIALLWEGNDVQEQKKLTYKELLTEVCRFANVLRKHGVKKGDRVTIYLPMIIELPVAMLACARIGAIHNIVFGGFSSVSLRDRIIDSRSAFVICANSYYRGTKTLDSKVNVDAAIEGLDFVKCVIVIKRAGDTVAMRDERDHWFHEEVIKKDISDFCPPEAMDSEDPLFILYTSGSTGKPKGVLHTQGGYLVYVTQTFKYIFDIKDEDIYWCTADIGWITGHSYIIYGPLSNGATSLIYESIPSYPDFGRFWQIVEKYKVNIFYTAPTVLRTLMKEGDDFINKYDLSSLRLLGTVGEPINPETWSWYYKIIGKERCPIVDTWWQTETGGVLITTLPGAHSAKPGSAGLPFWGIDAKIIKENSQITGADEGGWLVIQKPWPGLMRRVYGNPSRFKDTYFSQFYGAYTTGDGARKDKDGYYWLMGRIDDVINVSGHRFGTAEIESAIVAYHNAAEAAVVGYPDEIKGQGIYAFVVLKNNADKDINAADEIKKHVRKLIGPIATPDAVQLVEALPKTRSGKIMRRILMRIAAGESKNLGDISTLLNPEIIEILIKDRVNSTTSAN